MTDPERAASPTSTAPWMVLVGPAGSGKTTLGARVAEATGRAFIDLDAVGERYYAEVGWSIALLRERIAAVGRLAAEIEWEPARAHAVTRAVTEYPDAVIALGAGHTSYTDGRRLAEVQHALLRCADVVHVLPSADRDLSLSVLRDRCEADKGRSWIVDGHDFLAAWLDDPALRRLATRTVFTLNETPERTVQRLLRAE